MLELGIRFSNGKYLKKCDEPYFFGDAGIDGTVSIRDDNRIAVDLIKISLEGVLVNTIDHPESNSYSLKRISKLLDLSDIKTQSDITLTNNGREGSCKFHFDVPRSVQHAITGENDGYLIHLPPSIVCHKNPRDVVSGVRRQHGSCVITYSVVVEAIRGRREPIAYVAQKIKLISTLGSRPPPFLDHFGTEYTMAASSVRKITQLGKRKRCSLQIEAFPPRPTTLNKVTSSFEVSVPIRIHATTPDGNSDVLTSIGSLDVGATLVSRTLISVLPRRSVPTVTDANKSKSIAAETTIMGRTTGLVKLGNWTAKPPSFDRKIDSKSQADWQCDGTMELAFDQLPYIIPTFDSALVSHRYTLQIQIDKTSSPKEHFDLRVPIEISYRVDKSSGGRRYSGSASSMLSRASIIRYDEELVCNECASCGAHDDPAKWILHPGGSHGLQSPPYIP